MLSSESCESEVSHSHHHKTGFGTVQQPSGTTEYVTSSRDTLRSIAVAFDTTTTRLMKLNRMSSLTVFPGQTLYVPCQPGETCHSPSPPPECEEITSTLPSKSDPWGTSFTGEFSFLSPLSPSSSSLRAFKDLVMVSSKVEPEPDKNSNVEMNNHQETSAERRKAFQLNKQDGGVRESGSHVSLSRSNSDRQRIMSGESTESEPFEEGFLKMSVQYITDTKETVHGVMLVTPTALMFDPDADDDIAVRDGCDNYGIMCPMHLINSVAMYNDISRMTPSSQSSVAKTPTTPATDQQDHDITLEVDRTTVTAENNNAPDTEAKTGKDNHIDDLLQFDTPLTQNDTTPVCEGVKTMTSDSKASLQHTNKNCRKPRLIPGMARPAVITQPRDYSSFEAPTEIIVEDRTDLLPEKPPGNKNTENNEVKLESEFPFIHSIMRTVEDYLPVLEADPTKEHHHQTHRKPNSNLMFLCIRARRPMLKTFSVSDDDEVTLTSADSSPERHERLPEYWFQVPRKKSDHVYAFFLQWSAEDHPNNDVARELGFVVMAEEPYPDELDDANQNEKKVRARTNSSLEFVDDFFDDSYSFEKEWEWIVIYGYKLIFQDIPSSVVIWLFAMLMCKRNIYRLLHSPCWGFDEIISIQEAKRRSIATNAIELAEADDSLIPELEKPSNLLTESTLLSLCRNLPNRCVGYSWYPVYRTSDHGTSLRTLYRNMADVEAPVVIIIEDSNDHIFGALCSTALHVSDHYYGTGESFLFTLSPDFEVFKWTGENSFFIKGDTDALTFGGGKGTFGLWLDADLYRGCSHPCDTYNNKVLSCDEDFVVQSIEVWMIKDM